MPGLLSNIAVSDEVRRQNDRHRPLVVIAVLAMLALYLYLFTHAGDSLGIPRPQELAARLGVSVDLVFSRDGNVDTMLHITSGEILPRAEARAVLFEILALAFLSVYFLPLGYKQTSLVVWTVIGLGLLYGRTALFGLLCAHIVVYLVLHPNRTRNLGYAALAGLLGYGAFIHEPGASPERYALAVVLPTLAVVLYWTLLLRLLAAPRVAPVLRTITVQSAILTVCISACIEGLSGLDWRLPLGVLLFFWQWERLIMYHIDYKDGQVPQDISLLQYLVVFFHPGSIPNWTWGVTIGQGYTYSHNGFLAEDKNKLVLEGLKLWAIALIYIIGRWWIPAGIAEGFHALGIPVTIQLAELTTHFARGGDAGALTVLCTSMLDLTRWIVLWAGIVHFKVGIWRICGYRMDPYIHRPWASTNLMALWTRFSFHYREFLLRAFYYPIFLRYFKKQPYVRVVVGIMAAAGFGNLVWGHISEGLFYQGMVWEEIVRVLRGWPYFLMLGIGVGLTNVYLLRHRRTRRAWTLDRWIWTDVLAVYCTLQYWALARVLGKLVPGGTNYDSLRLFAAAFGIKLDP